jgi:mRNA interferase MazF
VGKPVVGDIVVLPFPQTNLQAGKRRPALVVADLADDDLILCQVTSQPRPDGHSILLAEADFAKGRLSATSYARANRLFTTVILYVAAQVNAAKVEEVKAQIRALFT